MEYETGFIRFLGGTELGRSGWWKFVALVVVIMMMIGVWSTGYFEVADESVSEHGVKAAVLAIATATMVFVSMIGRGARTRQGIDPWIQLVSGGLALLTGWYWLLAETGGNPWPFLSAVLPFAVVLTIIAVFNLCFAVLYRSEGEYIQQRHDDQIMKQLNPSERAEIQQIIDRLQQSKNKEK